MCAKMAQYLPCLFLIRQIVTTKSLSKCHVLPSDPDNMAVLGIGTKIAKHMSENTMAFPRRLMI